ncbi:MAG: hypothetical protein WCX97_00095 [Candidatus Magasanikbacteria bacterium]
MFKRTMLVVGALAMVLLVSGCGQKSLTEKNIEKELEKSLGGNAKVDLQSGAVSLETDQGSIQVGGEVSLPKDFPSDIYVIDGKLMSAMKNVMGAGYQVVLQSNASVKDAKELYEKKMKEQGWAVAQSADMGTVAMLSFSKGKRQLSVTLGTEEGKEGLAVVLTSIEEQL